MPPAPGDAEPTLTASGLLSLGPLVLHGQKCTLAFKSCYQSFLAPYGGVTWTVIIFVAYVTMQHD